MDTTKLNQHSEACVPAFALVQTGSNPHAPGTYAPLDVAWAEKSWPVTAAGETLVRRFVSWRVVAFGLVDDDGCPARASTGSPSTAVELFKAGGIVIVTDRRIAGLLTIGESALAPIDADAGRTLVFSIPYEEILEISASLGRRTLGSRDRILRLSLRELGHVGLVLDRVVDDERRARKFDLTELLDQVVALTATRVRPGASATQRDLLTRAERGERRREGDDVTAVLGLDEDEDAFREASGDRVAFRPPPLAEMPQAPGLCLQCGTPTRPRAKFCHDCGAPLAH